MRKSTLIASLAIFLPLVLSNPAPAPAPVPEPCSDHPGVVHEGSGLADIASSVAHAAKLTLPGSDASSSSSTTTSSGTKSKSKSKNKSDSSSSSSDSSESSSGSSSSSSSSASSPKVSFSAKPKKSTPKVKAPSKSSLTSGAQEAVDQFSSSKLIPGTVGSSLGNALGQAIADQLTGSKKNVTKTRTSHEAVITKIANGTKAHVVNGTTISPSLIYVTVTKNVTQTVTSDYSSSSAVAAAALNVKQAIDQAFAAVNLSQSGLDAQTVSALESCLTTVLSSGGLPSGYACLTETGSNAAGLESTLNNVLEQFEGILPNVILENVFGAVTPSLTALLPASEQALISEIEASIKSVVATLSAGSVTAMEQLSKCYTEAIQMQGNTSSLACYSKTAGSTLATMTNSVIESFTGVLPGSLVTTVENILSYNLQDSTTASDSLAAKVQAQISNAITSAGNTLSGNTVSLAETLQACATLLLQTGNGTAAEECITKGNAPVLSATIINGIAEQFEGYLPSSFFTDLVEEAKPLIANLTANPTAATEAQIDAAFDSYFNNATQYGPAYETCIEQVQQCVTSAIQKSGTLDAVCPGPVKGCDLPKTSTKAKRYFGDDVHSGFLRRKKHRSF